MGASIAGNAPLVGASIVGNAPSRLPVSEVKLEFL